MKRQFLALLLLCPSLQQLRAHETGTPHNGPEVAPGIIIEVEEGVNPWNHLKLHNDPKAFQFAVVTDRTGGHRPGVFEEGIRKLNLLQPEFVMSVGDLIEGYSEDRTVINAQWDEFQGFIRQLEMPFFYVPGNHDYTNPTMAEIWKQRFGRGYYSFVYRNVLFLCLNSLEPQMHWIGQEQIEWVKRTLAANKDVRWTLVFLHTPMWDEIYDTDDHHGWDKVDAALQDRPFTVFSGHFHNYLKRTKNDRRYYTLATTGGGSELRGPSYGQFDQVAWVTMTEAGPLVANLLLQGIWDDNVRTEELRTLVKGVSGGVLVRPETVWAEGDHLDPTRVEVRFANPMGVPVEITFSLAPMVGVKIQPLVALQTTADGKYTKILQPNTVSSVDFQISADRIPVRQAIAAVPMGWEARFQPDHLPPVTLHERSGIAIVPRLNLERIGSAIQVDAQLADWAPELFEEITQPGELLNKAEAWTGPDDCRFRQAFAYDDNYFYGAVEVKDEQLIALPEVKPWAQDGIEVRIDPRPAAERDVARYDDKANILLIACSPNENAAEPWLVDPAKLPEGTKAACIRTPGGYVLEFAVPLPALRERAGGDWTKDGFRINVAVNDRDGLEQTQLWWQPDWRGRNHIPESGTLRPKKP